MTHFEQCLLSEQYTHYWQPISDVSDSLGEFLSGCTRKVFHFEPFCDADTSLRNVHRVDAIAIRRKNPIQSAHHTPSYSHQGDLDPAYTP